MRSAVLDQASQPIRNLVKSPRANSSAWAVTGYGTGGAGTFTVTTGAARDGVGSAGVQTWTTAATAGGASMVTSKNSASWVPVVAGRTYSWGIWVKQSQALSLATRITWSDAANALVSSSSIVGTTPAVDSWTRVTSSGVAPAGAVWAQVEARVVNISGMINGYTLTADEAMMVEGTTLPDYADGDSPGWKWTGAANITESVGYTWANNPAIVRKLIRNLHQNPAAAISGFWMGAANNATYTREDNTVLGTTHVAKVDFTGSTVADSGINFTGNLTQTALGLLPSRRYTISFSIVSETTRSFKFSKQGTGVVSGTLAPFTLTANVPRRMSYTFDTSASVAGAVALYVLRTDSELGTFRASQVMITEGETVYDYADGSVPGWTWTGTALRSVSTGYPYTLESIAGKPVYFAENVTASGNYSTNTRFTTTQAYPLTIVATQVFPDPPTGAPGAWEMASSVANGSGTLRRMIVTSAATYGYNYGRFLTNSTWQTSHINAVVPGATAHTHVTRMGEYSMDASVDGNFTNAFPNQDLARPLTAGARLVIGGRDGAAQATAPATRGFAAFSYSLDDETVKRVTAWFARKYGTPIPAGY